MPRLEVKFRRAIVMNYSELNSQELISRCVSSREPEAWEEFVKRFQPLIAGVVARAAMRWTQISAALIDDLIQETYLKLCTEEFRRLRDFESHHEGAIYGFLKTVAYNVTMDYFKVHHASKRGANLASDADFDTTLEATGRESLADEQILVHEIEALLVRISKNERDRSIFLLYYRHGFSAKTIAGIPGIELTQKGVESCLLRIVKQLQQHVAGARAR
jgi:RNA polymerase sigma-70 factor, ECF subfamily